MRFLDPLGAGGVALLDLRLGNWARVPKVAGSNPRQDTAIVSLS